MNKNVLLGGLAASHLAVFGIGWALAPDEPLDEEVQQTGFMKVQTTKVLEATVQSLRAEQASGLQLQGIDQGRCMPHVLQDLQRQGYASEENVSHMSPLNL
jgi:hypothetical protein